MAELILGPVLRHVAETEATIWVESSRPCEVEILAHRASTFSVEGHHYAIVHVGGLAPDAVHPYEVVLDGARAWPPARWDWPASVIRTLAHDGPLRLAFGSCRVALPHEPPYTLPKSADPRGRGPDALHALALRLTREPHARWPDLLMMLGDQVYADEVSPATLAFIRARRDCAGPHGKTAADFEEYHRLYLDAWGDPTMRWLLSTVPSAMIFDDHDVHDDWNTSLAWRRQIRGEPWWQEHIVAALSSYWVYQHLGNLSPAELAQDALLARLREGRDGTEALRSFARRADEQPDSARWSYARDLGRARLVVIDSRAGRLLDPERRSMLDEAEWQWLERQLTGDFDHLLIGTSLPLVLSPGLHGLEEWSEGVCAGAWGRPFERSGERVRERFDLEHWAAFDRSFRRLAQLLRDVASGHRDAKPPLRIILLSGDVHHSYLAQLDLRDPAAASAVYQAVSSPFRNELDRHERAVVRLACSRAGGALGQALAHAAGRRRWPIRWKLTPRRVWFDNQVGELELDGRSATLTFSQATQRGGRPTGLAESLRYRLS